MNFRAPIQGGPLQISCFFKFLEISRTHSGGISWNFVSARIMAPLYILPFGVQDSWNFVPVPRCILVDFRGISLGG